MSKHQCEPSQFNPFDSLSLAKTDAVKCSALLQAHMTEKFMRCEVIGIHTQEYELFNVAAGM